MAGRHSIQRLGRPCAQWQLRPGLYLLPYLLPSSAYRSSGLASTGPTKHLWALPPSRHGPLPSTFRPTQVSNKKPTHLWALPPSRPGHPSTFRPTLVSNKNKKQKTKTHPPVGPAPRPLRPAAARRPAGRAGTAARLRGSCRGGTCAPWPWGEDGMRHGDDASW